MCGGGIEGLRARRLSMLCCSTTSQLSCQIISGQNTVGQLIVTSNSNLVQRSDYTDVTHCLNMTRKTDVTGSSQIIIQNYTRTQ